MFCLVAIRMQRFKMLQILPIQLKFLIIRGKVTTINTIYIMMKNVDIIQQIKK